MIQNSLFSFGCSHMYGWNHLSTNNNTNPSKSVYTNLLAEHYNLKHYNFSEVGASNQSIMRQILFAENFEKENNLNSIYWIQWSAYERLELPYLKSKDSCKNWPYVLVLNEFKNKSNNKKLNQWAKQIYGNVDDLALFVLSCNTIIQANSFLKSRNKKVINTFSHTWNTSCDESNYYIKKNDSTEPSTMYNEILLKKTKEFDLNYTKNNLVIGKSNNDYKSYDPYIQMLWTEIKTYNWHYWNDEIGFAPWSVKNNYGLYASGHPTEKAHKEAFQFILKKQVLEK